MSELNFEKLKETLNSLKVPEKIMKLNEILIQEGYSNDNDKLYNSLATLSNSIRKYYQDNLNAIVKKNKDAKDAEITALLEDPLAEQKKLQVELSKLLAAI